MSYPSSSQNQSDHFYPSESSNRVYRAANEEPPTTSDQEFHELQVPKNSVPTVQMQESSYSSGQQNSQSRYVNVEYRNRISSGSNGTFARQSVSSQRPNNTQELRLPGPSNTLISTDKMMSEGGNSILSSSSTFGSRVADTKQYLEVFWLNQRQKMLALTEEELKEKCKHMALPVARVKKIMRIDENVRNLMISGDAPVFMAAAAEMFIEEITGMSWHVVDETRRRTMLKSDIVSAMHRNEQFDFLIDFIPRKRSKPVVEQKPVHQINQTQRENKYPDLRLDNISRHAVQSSTGQVGRESGVSYVSVLDNPAAATNGYEQVPTTSSALSSATTSTNVVNDYIEPQHIGAGVTISIDENGDPIGELPPGMQLVINTAPDGQKQYRLIDRRTNSQFQAYEEEQNQYITPQEEFQTQ